MVGVGALAKARAGDNTDSGLLQEGKAIEGVGSLTSLLGSGNELKSSVGGGG